MRSLVLVVSAGLLASLVLGAAPAFAAGSCSVFAKIESYDAAAKTVTIAVDKRTRESKFFPRTEGAPPTSKIPSKCKSKTMRQKSFAVHTTGGRMSITQMRENFNGKMLNDVEDPEWVSNKLNELVAGKTVVSVVLRQPPGKGSDAPHEVTTLYLPITEAELAEIARINSQASDD
jgi:hypothetical protein